MSHVNYSENKHTHFKYSDKQKSYRLTKKYLYFLSKPEPRLSGLLCHVKKKPVCLLIVAKIFSCPSQVSVP